MREVSCFLYQVYCNCTVPKTHTLDLYTNEVCISSSCQLNYNQCHIHCLTFIHFLNLLRSATVQRRKTQTALRGWSCCWAGRTDDHAVSTVDAMLTKFSYESRRMHMKCAKSDTNQSCWNSVSGSGVSPPPELSIIEVCV